MYRPLVWCHEVELQLPPKLFLDHYTILTVFDVSLPNQRNPSIFNVNRQLNC